MGWWTDFRDELSSVVLPQSWQSKGAQELPSRWVPVRDAAESLAAVAGNYLLPGSGLITPSLVSKGSQEQLQSDWGRLAMLGSGLAGVGFGSSLTGISSAADAGYGWANAANTLGIPGFGPTTSGMNPADFGIESGNQFFSPGTEEWFNNLGTASGWGGGAAEALGELSRQAAGGGGGFSWGDAGKAIMKYASPAMSIGSGIYGMSQARKMREDAKLAGERSDPWGNSGGRALADTQLQSFMRDPMQQAMSDPSYRMRIQGAQRGTSMMGTDSGAMAKAAADASSTWYNERLAQLGGLAGSNVNPGQGPQVMLQGMERANDLASKSLGSISFGMNRMGGSNIPENVRQYLLAQGVNI